MYENILVMVCRMCKFMSSGYKTKPLVGVAGTGCAGVFGVYLPPTVSSDMQ